MKDLPNGSWRWKRSAEKELPHGIWGAASVKGEKKDLPNGSWKRDASEGAPHGTWAPNSEGGVGKSGEADLPREGWKRDADVKEHMKESATRW